MGIVCPLSLNLCHEGDSQEENGGGGSLENKGCQAPGWVWPRPVCLRAGPWGPGTDLSHLALA